MSDVLFVLYISGEGLEEDEFVDVREFWLVRKNRGQEMTDCSVPN